MHIIIKIYYNEISLEGGGGWLRGVNALKTNHPEYLSKYYLQYGVLEP